MQMGNYQARPGCHDCDRGVWYEVDENGTRWHKSWRLCEGDETAAKDGGPCEESSLVAWGEHLLAKEESK